MGWQAHGGAADMEARGREAQELDGRVEQLIGAAVLAHSYRVAIMADPTLRPGFGKLATKHSARVAALACEIAAGARRTDGASATMRAR